MRCLSAKRGTTGTQIRESTTPSWSRTTGDPSPVSSYQRSVTPTDVSLPAHAIRACPRRRGRSDGRRDRPGRGRGRLPRLPPRRGSRCDRPRARDDAEEPRQAGGEGWSRSRRDTQPGGACRRSRRGRPDGGGGRRGPRRQGGDLPASRFDPAAGGRARLKHVVDPDRLPGGRHLEAGKSDRHALLQPGAGAEARRGDPWARDLRRDRRGRRRLRRGARQGACAGERLPRLRLEPDPDAVHQRGRLGAPRRRRGGGGDRHDREARLRAPDGPARTCRPDRARHVRGDHGGAPRGARGREVRAVPAPARARRGGTARPEVRTGLLQLRVVDFELTDDQREIQALTREFAQAEIEPQAAEWDREHSFPRELFAKLAELGLMGACIPEEYGGAGADFLAYILVLEELSRADAGVGVTVAVHTSAVTLPILTFGTDEQRSRFVPPLARGEAVGAFALTEPEAGSDAGSLRTAATPSADGWSVSGTKQWITNGGFC